jgi:hypothetical protein
MPFKTRVGAGLVEVHDGAVGTIAEILGAEAHVHLDIIVPLTYLKTADFKETHVGE